METPTPPASTSEPPPVAAQPTPVAPSPPPPPQPSTQPQPSSIPSTPEANPPPSSSSSAAAVPPPPQPQPQSQQDPQHQPQTSQSQAQTPIQTQSQNQNQTQNQTQTQTQPVQQPQPTLPTPQQQRPPLAAARPQAPYAHFSQSPSTTLPSPSPSPTPMQRGGLAIGVPAHHPRPHQPPVPFSTYSPSQAFGQPFSGMPRGSAEQSPNSNAQARQPVQGIQTIGMIGSLSSGSQLRPSGIPSQHQPRPGQPPLRSASPSTTQTLSNQKFQSHSLARGPSLTSPSSPSPGPQSTQPGQHQWMSTQAKQIHASPLPSSSYRPHIRPQVQQQRPNVPQQHQHTLSTSSHQQQILTSQQQQQNQKQQQQQKHQLQLQQMQQQQTQISQPHQAQELRSQPDSSSRNQQSLQQQQQAARGLGSALQKTNVQASVLPGAVQPGPISPIVTADTSETGNQILSKRTIHELVAQIDPSEKLDPEVEDVLVEIADDFIESVTTFGCSLAKHRKSTTLEAKDILLHVERNWNMALPGFGGDEIKCYKKPFMNDIHKERLAAIKKSMAGTGDAGNVKNSAAGHAGANPKGHSAKTPAVGSPKT